MMGAGTAAEQDVEAEGGRRGEPGDLERLNCIVSAT